MGPAWLGLLGAVVGGLVSLIGTLVTTRFQWRQEQARWLEQRERDRVQWQQQRDAEAQRWADERQRDKADWLREQKHKSYLEVLDHLLAASQLASKLPPAGEDDLQPYPREDELAIADELTKSYRWLKSASAVCDRQVTQPLKELSAELYFTIQVVLNEGIQRNKMVRRPEHRTVNPWILNEVIDQMSARLSEVSRADLGAD